MLQRSVTGAVYGYQISAGPEIRRWYQIFLNQPITTLVRMKTMIAAAAILTASAMRKSNRSTIMMFFSIPKFLGLVRAAPLTGCQK